MNTGKYIRTEEHKKNMALSLKHISNSLKKYEKKCIACNKEFEPKNNPYTQKFCSDICLGKHRKEYEKKYYNNYRKKNREKMKIYRMEYWKKNKEELKKCNRKRWNNNRIKNLEKHKEWYNKNKEKVYIIHRLWEKQNLKKVREYKKNWKKRNPIITRLRTLFNMGLKRYIKTGKIWSSKKYGIDYKSIIEHLKPFPENLQDYDIHHIKPLFTFKFTNPDGSTNLEEVRKAWEPENLKWLTIEEHKKIHHRRLI